MKFIVFLFIAGDLMLSSCFAQQKSQDQKFYEWDFSAAGNFVPNQPFTVTPLAAFSTEHFHSELRYNYEDIKTFSFAAGYRFAKDDTIFWYDATPMIGASVGHFNGISPELTFDVGVGPLALSADLEYSFSFDSSAANSFFIWSELTYDITSNFYAGLSLQRSQVYKTSNAVDFGVVVGFIPGAFGVFAQASNFWNSNRYFIVGLSYSFIHGDGNKKQTTAPLK